MLKKGLLERRLETEDVFTPKETILNIQVQRIFPFGVPESNKIIRDFYEALAKSIFAGETRERQNLLQKESERVIEADLTDQQRGRYIEVKAAGHTRRIMLKDEQIEKYALLQISDYPIENPRIYFVFFRYGLRGIQTRFKEKPAESLIEYFAKDTRFMTGITFSVIYRIHQEGLSGNPLATRTHGDSGIPCTNFSTSLLICFSLNQNRLSQSLDSIHRTLE